MRHKRCELWTYRGTRFNPNVQPAQMNNTNPELNNDPGYGARHQLLYLPDTDLEASCAYLEIKKSNELNAVQNGSAMNEIHQMKEEAVLNGAALRQNSAEGHVKKNKEKDTTHPVIC
ncbi:hypothetical protein DPMN_090790 [Dreissena polymorpha]|uniref:Uncharacterized protein n=1 Tax=Dreissena polymorpha TaxID=45954 RepID=A0A9D4L0F0_DREPO|nr:hypothetical protein DPMN_090790 [Dreissena polymorpha]